MSLWAIAVLLLASAVSAAIGLRRSRPADEKRDFTLILAYWQTIRDAHNHPDDVDPRENPAFQPARNALRVACHLIPSAVRLLCALLIACFR